MSARLTPGERVRWAHPFHGEPTAVDGLFGRAGTVVEVMGAGAAGGTPVSVAAVSVRFDGDDDPVQPVWFQCEHPRGLVAAHDELAAHFDGEPPVSCDDAHPDCDVHHPGGHE